MVLFWCDYGYNIEIGEHFFANHNTIILDGEKIIFCDHVFIVPRTAFFCFHRHHLTVILL